MKFEWNVRKVIILVILLLLGCDVTFLFAAQSGSDNNASQQLQQIQQLQLAQADTSTTATTNTATTAANNTPDLSAAVTPPGSPSGVNGGSSVPPDFSSASNNAPVPNVNTAAPNASNVTPYNTAAPANNPSNNSVAPPASNPDQLLPTQGAAASLPPPPQNSQFAAPQPSALPPPALGGPPPSPQGQVPPGDSGTVSTSDIRNQAFNTMVQGQLPMTPEQIQRLRELFNQTQFAAASTPGTPPRPTATSQLVNLAPGSTPPVIRLAQGFVSSLVFIDSTGAPWPIANYDIGNPSAFNIQWNKSDNTLMIQATTLYTYGNLAVRLQGLNTPVMLTLVPGQRAVDYRVDLRIQGTGPNAIPVPVTGLPSAANPELLGVLDGVPPTGSTEVRVSCGGGVQAWLRGDQLFVRTRYTIISPGWIATMTSADGTKAYQMGKAPLLLAAENGKIVQVKIEGL